MSRRRPRRRFGGGHLAGWLFADLMLVLFLVAMAVQPRAQIAVGKTPEKRPTPDGPRVLGQEFCEFMIPVRADGLLGGASSARADLLSKVRGALRGEHPSWLHGPEMHTRAGRASCDRQIRDGLKVGFFLVYGAQSDVNRGVQLGQKAAKAIRTGDDRFGEAIYRAAWTGGEGGDAVQIITFFYQN
jgi:hypothetical protein